MTESPRISNGDILIDEGQDMIKIEHVLEHVLKVEHVLESACQRSYPAGVIPEFDFAALGIYSAPSWSVQLPDGSGGTQVVQVPGARTASSSKHTGLVI